MHATVLKERIDLLRLRVVYQRLVNEWVDGSASSSECECEWVSKVMPTYTPMIPVRGDALLPAVRVFVCSCVLTSTTSDTHDVM